MPSNDVTQRYLQLHELTARIKAALADEDYHALGPMITVHKELMKQITGAGDNDDKNLLPVLKEIKRDIDAVIRDVEIKKGTIQNQLRASGNRRKLARAYGA